MRFEILGHASLLAEANGVSIVCDPWIVGSCYWRSWWNYPPLDKERTRSLSPDFIYLTHLHWDHFHGPSLRKLGLDVPVVIPKTPDLRMKDDLQKLGVKTIHELPHGGSMHLAPGFRITSYQFGLFPDSVLIIEADGTALFNCNDAKVMGSPLRHILERHPRMDFVFRSHSSANSRLCYRITDRGDSHADQLDTYNKQFAQFAQAVGARYAVPFASNHCHLHPESIRYNQFINFAPRVATYFDEQGIKRPSCVVMKPGDSWSTDQGFEIDDTDWYDDFEVRIEKYREAVQTKLADQEAAESSVRVTDRLIDRYIQQISGESPAAVRRFFRRHPITLVLRSGDHSDAFLLDIARGRWRRLETWDDQRNPIQVRTSALIFKHAVMTGNWTGLVISKRVEFRVRNKDKRYIQAFLFLNNSFDHWILPLQKTANRRFWSVWASRWREVPVYLDIVTRLARGKSFDFGRYVPPQKN